MSRPVNFCLSVRTIIPACVHRVSRRCLCEASQNSLFPAARGMHCGIAALSPTERAGSARRNVALLPDDHSVALSVFCALLPVHLLRCGGRLCPLAPRCDASALRSRRRGCERAGARSCGRLSGRRAHGRGAVCRRCAPARRSRASAGLLQQCRSRLYPRHVRKHRIPLAARGTVSLSRPRRLGRLHRHASVP